jgi:hypothetical protein
MTMNPKPPAAALRLIGVALNEDFKDFLWITGHVPVLSKQFAVIGGNGDVGVARYAVEKFFHYAITYSTA